VLNAVIALAIAVTLVVAPPSAFAGAGAESTTVAEIVEDLDPDVGTLVAAASPVPATIARRCDDASGADPALACAMPPPVPPPER
jgi:hypothetical protein